LSYTPKNILRDFRNFDLPRGAAYHDPYAAYLHDPEKSWQIAEPYIVLLLQQTWIEGPNDHPIHVGAAESAART